MHDVESNRLQAVIGLVETVRHVASRDETAVETVLPAVVRARERFGLAALLEAHERTTMAAHVGECAQLTVFAAHDNRRLARHFHDLEIAGRGQLGNMPRQYPVAVNHALELERVDGQVGIKTLGQRISGTILVQKSAY